MLFLCRAALAVVLGIGGLLMSTPASASEPVYELRIYTAEPGKLEVLHERFPRLIFPLFERHGLKSVGYWVPTDGPESQNQLIYLLEHASRDAAKASWDAFLNDPEWKQLAADGEKQHGKILAKRPESIFLAKTDYSPAIGLPSKGKIYELRTYTASAGKLDRLNARFRDHTIQLFRKHGMESYGYWIPTDAPESSNTLIYLLEHSSRESAEAGFAAFRTDPEWIKARDASQQDGSLTAQRPDSKFLKLADYSPQR